MFGLTLEVSRQEFKDDKNQHAWLCKLSRDGKSFVFDFHMGKGRSKKGFATRPTFADVLPCLQSDANAGGSTFQDFCCEFGYNVDSIADSKVYDACVNTANELHKLLGKDFAEFTLHNFDE